MAATIPEFGEAVNDALQWLEHSPETAGPVLGINSATLNAMSQGIVPMRSLVIRFAEQINRLANGRGDPPEGWRDVDGWLALAGLPPQRPLPPRRDERADPDPDADAAPPADPDAPAAEHYHPRYERAASANGPVHVFWLSDARNRPVFRFNLPSDVDCRERAARLKQELARLSKTEFDDKYARYRLSDD